MTLSAHNAKKESKNRPTVRLGLIGSGIQASRTPAMHELEAAEHGIRCIYELIDLDRMKLDVSALPELLTQAERMGFTGLNITHPCKQAVIPHLNELSEDVHALGAVNTVVLRNGRRHGHNTDWLGFSQSFVRGLRGAAIRSVAQLGAGGAGAATAYAMLKMGASHLAIVDTDGARAEALVERYARLFARERISASSDVESALMSAEGVIHATPTGMKNHPGMAVPPHLLRPDLWVAEIVYFPLETELLRAAKAAGCRTMDGSGMAVYQAAEAFRLFFGLEPNVDRMHDHFVAQVRSE